ncbi:MAG TPA: hypothetical protein VFH70_00340 [Acidimicrobiales bacterium]|nr:hypothetical protein [Acidimicrobiales bacterium]
MEGRVALAERFLAGEPVELTAFARPDGLGPLPAQYAERARRIHAATVVIEERLAARMQESRSGQVRPSAIRAFTPERPEPAYFDRSA